MMKTLVLYVFHIYNERVKYFIDNCIFPDENIDFMIICNNKNLIIDIPKYAKIIYRDNIGYDFGGWSDALLTNNLYNSYDYFIFANSSIIGPYLKPNSTEKWTDIYINGLKDNIKLFGSTINCFVNGIRKPHVQSYIYSVNKETLEYLIKCEIFSTKNIANTFNDAIINKEVLMSTKILENGWNIGSLLNNYKGIDFTCNVYFQHYDDIMYDRYRNILWNEYELVFIKGNRINIQFPQVINVS